ncbi:Ribosome quality control (RQC) complex component, YloA/Tae2 family [Methanonatronarchaeum thermophilum]|uniref:Ribosome quality control (RQC) complex component, YloA/Tae2 family n=1 Tax=Methanonatronarchaeum thermophilum TaxID=1927129 RepID=A0A1Y3GCP8_9EURY|nr:ribosome rescue protein RqcH [Methanonatronarchaeum thermophilum]OUJ19218.1 Ribosome quality control (RQC) complex component, YloA/Tae2 family [Methanonatronarchaeum thermophilum]
MKERMTSVDVAAIQSELGRFVDARVEKSYQLTENEVLIKLYHHMHGKANLLIVAGERIHFTEYPRPAPERPPNFPMVLRKHTKGGVITGVRQYDFDRIVEIDIERGGEEMTLVAELFGEGNVILTSGGEIIAPLKRKSFRDRRIKRGDRYEYPPSNENPLELELGGFKEIFSGSDSDVVRTLATKLNIGGTYAEEICLRSGVEKNKDVSVVGDSELERLYNALSSIASSIRSGDIDPQIVEDDGKVDVVPLKLEIYQDMKTSDFDSFNTALDEFFSKDEIQELEEEKKNKYREKLEGLEGRKKGQLGTAKKYMNQYHEGIEKGDLIYAYFTQLKEILNTIRDARENYSWSDIKDKFRQAKEKELEPANIVKEINENKGELVVKLDDKQVTIDIRKSIEKNAQKTYQKAKKMKRKSKGARKAAEKTQELIDELKKKDIEEFKTREIPQRKVRKKNMWYDKYRWFKSSDGFLVIAGRNATQNEEIVKKHMDDNDLFFHTQMEGAPAVVIKSMGKKIPETTKEEAAVFAASNSNAWKKYYSTDVYSVSPHQVTKTPESGEYVGKGGFVIRGEREYYRNTPLKHSVGIQIQEQTRVIGGPPSSIKTHSEYKINLKPGDTDRMEAAEKIQKHFLQTCKPEDRDLIKKIAKPTEIDRHIPPGDVEIQNADSS